MSTPITCGNCNDVILLSLGRLPSCRPCALKANADDCIRIVRTIATRSGNGGLAKQCDRALEGNERDRASLAALVDDLRGIVRFPELPR